MIKKCSIWHCFYFIIFFVCGVSIAAAQSIGNDSRGKDIFDFYKTKSISIPASSANGSLKIAGTSQLFKTTQYFISPIPGDHLTGTGTGAAFHYTASDSAKLTYAQSWGINWSFEVSNIKNNLSQIATFHPTYGVSVGFGRNVDVFNRWSNVYHLRWYQPTPWNINAYAKLDNVLIYDISKSSASREHPATFGVIAEASTFPLNWLVISASANYEYGTNLANLKNYQDNKPSYMNADIISLGDYVGKLGDLQRVNTLRFRVSVPIITPIVHLVQPLQPCIIPYYTCFGAADGRFKNMAGVFVSILGQEFFRKNDVSIISGAGFGLDWIKDTGWSKGNLFVSGSLDLYKLFGHGSATQQPTH